MNKNPWVSSGHVKMELRPHSWADGSISSSEPDDEDAELPWLDDEVAFFLGFLERALTVPPSPGHITQAGTSAAGRTRSLVSGAAAGASSVCEKSIGEAKNKAAVNGGNFISTVEIA